MVNFWSIIVNSKENKSFHILYKFMFLNYSQNNYTSGWLNFVQNTLDTCGYSNIWLSQVLVRAKWLSVS